MSTWSYCPECGDSLDRMGIAETVAGVGVCPYCHETIPANVSLADFLEDLERRISKLEGDMLK